jgi:8-oxo-dGTP pyrophosphatase MutT (NUDIX family)
MSPSKSGAGGAVSSAGGVVLRGSRNIYRVALVRRHDGQWVLPKGHVEDGEELAQAALREVEEETGLPSKDLFVADYLGAVPFRDFEGDPRKKLNHFFLMFYDGAPLEMHTDEDHLEAAWHPLPLNVPLKYRYQENLISVAAKYAGRQR